MGEKFITGSLETADAAPVSGKKGNIKRESENTKSIKPPGSHSR
jgi:hypothetical protein